MAVKKLSKKRSARTEARGSRRMARSRPARRRMAAREADRSCALGGSSSEDFNMRLWG